MTTVLLAFTVMTWNTMHYGWEKQSAEIQENRERTMFEMIRASGTDVFLMQETYGSFERFKAAFPDWHGVLLGACNSVYSRYPIVKTYDPYQAETKVYGCTNGCDYAAGAKGPFITAVAELDVNGRRVRVAPVAMNWMPLCVRLPRELSAAEALTWEAADSGNGGLPRPKAMEEILKAYRSFIDDSERVPFIMAGDFNSESHLDWTAATASRPDHAGRIVPWSVSTQMIAAGFKDTFRFLYPDPDKDYGESHSPLIEDPVAIRIDYIYSLGKSLKPVSSETVMAPYLKPVTYWGKRYDAFPSDHGFVITTFEIDEVQEK